MLPLTASVDAVPGLAAAIPLGDAALSAKRFINKRFIETFGELTE
jgi:hypothetical protein